MKLKSNIWKYGVVLAVLIVMVAVLSFGYLQEEMPQGEVPSTPINVSLSISDGWSAAI